MATADLRLGDAFKLLLIGGAVGAAGLYILSNIKSVEFEANRASRRAYPSHFWDFRDVGAVQANFNQTDYPSNVLPREGLLTSPDPQFGIPNFSALGGYEAPRNL